MLIEAPAKINLSLNVVGRRQDGYHLLETVMQTIGLYDRLEIGQAEGEPVLSCRPSELEGEHNLALRAARLLRQEYNVDKGCRLELVKGIPVAAGLGGGSSDAAAALTGLNELWQLGLETADLSALGARLGSDVPFFIEGGTAFVEGRGEVVKPLPPLPATSLVLVGPDLPLKTADVYAAGDFALTEKKGSAKLLAQELEKAPQQVVIEPKSSPGVGEGRKLDIAEFLVNDLESGAFALRRELGELKEELVAVCGRGVLMSGSGATFFVLCRDRAEAQEKAELLEKAGHHTIIARTL